MGRTRDTDRLLIQPLNESDAAQTVKEQVRSSVFMLAGSADQSCSANFRSAGFEVRVSAEVNVPTQKTQSPSRLRPASGDIEVQDMVGVLREEKGCNLAGEGCPGIGDLQWFHGNGLREERDMTPVIERV